MRRRLISWFLVVSVVMSLFATFPMSAFAFNKDTMNNLCPIYAYPQSWEVDGYFPTYTTNECTTKAGKIHKNDYCTITNFYYKNDKWVVKVKYPVSGGTKTAYAKAIRFFPDCYSTFEPYMRTADAKTYVSKRAGESIESSWYINAGDKFYVITRDGNGNAQVVYPLSGGGYKMGWIKHYDVKYKANTDDNVSDLPSTQHKIQNVNLTLSDLKPFRKGYTFNSWNTSKDGSGTKYSAGGTYKSNSATTLYAQWKINSYAITVNSANTAMGTVSGGGTYNYNSTATIKASAKTGYRFTKWNDGNTSSSRNVTVTGANTYTAYFEPIPYYITVVSANTTMGTVSGSGTYNYGSSMTMNASPKTGYKFTKWNDGNTSASRSVTVTGAKTYTAYFEALNYAITGSCVNLKDNTQGSSVGTISGLGTLSYGSSVKLIANPAKGFKFVKWNDGVTTASRTVTISGTKSYIAYFEPDPITCPHVFGADVVDRKASCTNAGELHRVCSKCEHVEYEVIPIIEHTFSTITVDATCTENGRVYKKCSVCGYEKEVSIISAYGHSFQYDIKEPTCVDVGTKTITCRNSNCDYYETEELEALGHIFSEDYTVIVEPTCTERGEKARLCTGPDCKEQYDNVVVDELGHDYEIEIIREPSTDSLGIRKFTCKVTECRHNYLEQFRNEINMGTIEVGYVFSVAGDTVNVPISFKNNEYPGIAGFTFKVHYDNSILTPVKGSKSYVTRSSLTTKGTLSCNLDQSGISIPEQTYAQVHWEKPVSAGNITTDGTLFTLTFKINEEAELGNYPITLTYDTGSIVDGNASNIISDVSDGSIVISNMIRGDINLDQSVDDHDCTLLAQYITKWKDVTFTDSQIDAADVHDDDKINTKDGVRLAQLRAGYQIEEEISTFAMLASVKEMSVAVGRCQGEVGKEIFVPVTLTENSGTAGFNFNISYDPDYLTPTSIVEGSLTNGGLVSNLQQDDMITSELDTINVYWSDTNDIVGTGVLFYIGFKVNDTSTVGDVSPIQISYDYGSVCNESLENIIVNTSQGYIEVVEEAKEDNPYSFNIENVTFSTDGQAFSSILPSNGNCVVRVDFESLKDADLAICFVAAYADSGAMLKVSSVDITSNLIAQGYCDTSLEYSTQDIESVKVFIWDSATSLKPLSNNYIVNNVLN